MEEIIQKSEIYFRADYMLNEIPPNIYSKESISKIITFNTMPVVEKNIAQLLPRKLLEERNWEEEDIERYR